MSGNITINDTTTVEQLHSEVYNTNLNDYAEVYNQLITDFPQFEQLIKEAEIFTSEFSLQQEGFIDFINQEIIFLYQDIANFSFPADVDIDAVRSLFRELGEDI